MGGGQISTILKWYELIGQDREVVDGTGNLCHVTGGTDTGCATAHVTCSLNLNLSKLKHLDMVI